MDFKNMYVGQPTKILILKERRQLAKEQMSASTGDGEEEERGQCTWRCHGCLSLCASSPPCNGRCVHLMLSLLVASLLTPSSLLLGPCSPVCFPSNCYLLHRTGRGSSHSRLSPLNQVVHLSSTGKEAGVTARCIGCWIGDQGPWQPPA